MALKVSIKDAAGKAIDLAGDEGIDVTVTGAYVVKATVSSGSFNSGTMGTATTASLGKSDFIDGVGFVNVKGAESAAVTVTASGSGSLSITSASTSFTMGKASTSSSGNTFAGKSGTAVTTGWYTGWYVPAGSTSNTLEFTYTAIAATGTTLYSYITVDDDSGTISGSGGAGANNLYYDQAYTKAAGTSYATVGISHTAMVAGQTYGVTDAAGGSVGTVTAQTAAAANGTVTVTPSSLRMATGSTASFKALVKDQFGIALAGVGVTVTASGRNSAKASQTIVTDANGYITYSFTDAGSTGTTDTLTFNGGTATNGTASITYGSATAGSVLVSTPSTNSYSATTLPGEDAYPKTYSDISAGDGAEAGAVTVYALVKDADALAMAGVPVTWTVTGTGCAITSTTASGYTSAAGVASASLYAWTAGNCVVTATAGGKSDTANSYWKQSTPTEARSIAATVSGNGITATVKDRFGNTIEGVTVKVTRTSGDGYFGSATTATADTDANGQVTFVVTGGAVNAKVSFTSDTYGQSDALKGLLDGTAAASAFTATTAGTSILDEAGIGASFDAAGVNSVSVDVTSTTSSDAVDAANEATDAANAATDAANAAAEAADAATAAAQDAQAAVAALASQVADLIAGIKAQITALTNLVIKIQKKVKA